MQDVEHAFHEVKELYEKILGTPAPTIEPAVFAPFPPGVDPLKHAVDEVQQLKLVSEKAEAAPQPVAWIPPADAFATSDGMVVRLEIPGIRREDLKVFVTGGQCVVRGRRRPPDHEQGLRPLSIERPIGPFERRFTLAAGCPPDKVTAQYREGVLELRIAGEAAGIPGEMTVEVA